MKNIFILLLAMIAAQGMTNASIAAPLIYHGNNPNITPTAPQFNAAGIEARATLTRPKQRVEATPTQTDAEIVRRSVLSSLSSTISAKLTGADSGSGRVNFGDGSYADYTTVNGTRTIVTHNLDGTTTSISFAL
jgi:hypothetical protein